MDSVAGATELRRTLDAAMSEEQLLQAVRSLARLFGWLTYHTRDSRRSDRGFVDLVLVKAPRVIFAELKTMRGALTPEQVRWGGELSGCEVEVYVWRPCDWSSGEIERILQVAA